MIKSKRMKRVYDDGEFLYYIYTPSIFKLYYREEKGRVEPQHRYKITHIIHMIKYIIDGGYNILYVAKNDTIVSYAIFTRCSKGLIKNSSKNDFYTIFLYTYPEYRSRGIASKMASVMLKKINLSFNYFYKTIDKDNFSSIKVAEKSGFEKICEANKIGLFHQIVPVANGNQFLYRFGGEK